MGFSSDRSKFLESPKKKKPEEPSFYKGERKKNPDWDKIEDFGSEENPMSSAKQSFENILLGIILISVFGFIVWYFEIPISRYR